MGKQLWVVDVQQPEDIFGYILEQYDNGTCVAARFPRPHGQKTAEYMVKACNAYGEMLVALEAARVALWKSEPTDPTLDAVRLVEIALARTQP